MAHADADQVVLDLTRAKDQIVPPHTGLHYREWLSTFSQRCPLTNYLEIGVSEGDLLCRITCQHGFGVDPSFDLQRNVAKGKSRTSLFQVTSDEFFKAHRWRSHFVGPFDAVMIDGMHLFEFVLRDFIKAERFSSPGSVIFIHDCLPLNELMAHRDARHVGAYSEDTPFPHWWTGDVWKIVPILRRRRPDLRVALVDCYPTGLVVVDGLNPRSSALERTYKDIVTAYSALESEPAELRLMYAENRVIPATEALEQLCSSFRPRPRRGLGQLLSRLEV